MTVVAELEAYKMRRSMIDCLSEVCMMVVAELDAYKMHRSIFELQ